jgi:hypothetical protein
MVSGQDEYTPSIEEVREDYVAANTRHYDAYLTGIPLATAQEVFRGDFDRMIERVRAEQREKIVQLLVDLVDPDDCWFDHHGGCQAHGYLSLKHGELCPVAEAKQWIDAAAIREAGD